MNEKWTLTITYSFFFKCLVTKRISIKVKVIVNQSQVKVCYLCCRLRLVIITSRRIKTFPCCNTCNNNKVSHWNKGVAFRKDDLWEALWNCIAWRHANMNMNRSLSLLSFYYKLSVEMEKTTEPRQL